MTTVRIIISLLAIVLALLLYASVERFWIQVNRFTILTSQARSNSTGLKLLQISDLHLQHFGWYEKQVLRRINEHQPDVVVITGDFIKKREFLVDTNSVSRREAFSAVKLFVRGIHAPMGIYACRGNNDITDDKEVSDALLALLQRENVSVLCNQGTFVQKNNVDYYLMGIDFPWFFPKQSADFAVVEENENHVLQAKSSEKNSYSHLLIGDNRSTWMNYEFCGSFRVSQPDKGGIGFTFYSQFDRGYDRFYRLRRRAGIGEFIFSPHGVDDPAGVKTIPFDLPTNIWHHFRVQVHNEASATRMKARIWPVSDPEPVEWQADARDTLATFRCGSVGVWSAGLGAHQFDDLLVRSEQGDTLLVEDFEATPIHQDPFGWVDFNYEQQAIPWMMRQIPDSAVSILLAHSPDVIRSSAAAGIDLQLSGHTHGGQLYLPFWGPVYNPLDIGRQYTRGLFRFEDTRLYVNRGIGVVLAPLRFCSRPEITIFDIH